MTEADWQACTEPKPMLEFLKGKASERKLRLFRCACCRRFEAELSTNPALRHSVELGESYADGLITKEVFEAGREELSLDHPLSKAVSFAVWPTANDRAQENRMACARLAWQLVTSWFFGQQENAVSVLKAECDAQSSLLRDVFGNPFHPVVLNPKWQVPNIVNLAKMIYDERVFQQMPELAETLERSGCHNADVLGHCRGPGPHVRGCWVLDLILGKE